MIIVEEVNTVTNKKRYKIVSIPEPDAFQTTLSSGTRSSWRTRRGAERALKKWNKENSWKENIT